MLRSLVRLVGGDPNRRDIEQYSQLVQRINTLEPDFRRLSEAELRLKTDEFRAQRAEGRSLEDLLPEAFAAVREATQRTLGLRHYDVQLIGGMVLHQGRVAEMRTGEGKTLVATLPLYLNALAGKGAHLITVNDYLARRDARWMGPIYTSLGLSVGVLQEAARTDNARKAFVYDPSRSSPQEDVHQLRMVDRAEAYAADITYGTNHEFGFDYLRDNLALRREERVQSARHYAIVDEVDNILIDEARTPLIISGPAALDPQEYRRMAQVVRQLRPEDCEIEERDRTVTLTEVGEEHVEQLLGFPLRDPDRPEDVTPEQARLAGNLQQALRSEFLFKRNRDYLVQAGQVIIVDEFTGRLMHGRRWSDGLHQAVEAKEGLEVQPENVTYATITLQNYFRLYDKLSGMTGTAVTESEEFSKIYKLEVVPIPTNLEYVASLPESDLIEVPYKEDGNRFFHYGRKEQPEVPVFWKRRDYADVVYRTEEVKLRAISSEILQMHAVGRPVLVGTTSVERSENLSERLHAEPLRRLALTLILRDTWFEKNNLQEDGRLIEELLVLNQPLNALTPAILRPLARPLEMSLNPEAEENLLRLARVLDLPEPSQTRLLEALQRGIAHQVLNAKRHAEESQIIAGAGAFGAVTIATNMAGRGVDIKLGGELAEEVLAGVNRILRRNGVEDPYDLTNEQRRQSLQALSPDQYGIYAGEVEYFLKHMREEGRVRELGGLHILGSERHEARRIDNQLRGRSARQGDPGSSRFYLSLEDDLMRRFGGSQVSDLMQRLKIDDAVPLASGLVSRLIEQAQTRVEGANFDVRKHLLEYDDVLNAQRNRIYAQRDRIFEKEDLSEDIRSMLENEVGARVQDALHDAEGPWRLLAWLDETQPPLLLNDGRIFPSYSLKLIHGALSQPGSQSFSLGMEEFAGRAMQLEGEHLLRAFEEQAERAGQHAEEQVRERRQAAETALEGVEIEAREGEREISPQALADAVNQVVSIDARLLPKEHMQAEAVEDLKRDLLELVEKAVWSRAGIQLLSWVQRRTGLTADRLPAPSPDLDQAVENLRRHLQSTLDTRRQRVLQEIHSELSSPNPSPTGLNDQLRALVQLPLTSQTVFDARTHQRHSVTAGRFTWVYLAASLLEDRPGPEIQEEVTGTLLEALDALQQEWGLTLWQRFGEHSLDTLAPDLRESIRRELEQVPLEEEDLETRVLREWPETTRQAAIQGLGAAALTQAQRELMLSMVGQIWVEYLTSMEGLRTSIGLEAYAQRDPLVEYKSRAFDMFQQLLVQVRAGIVSRLFRLRLLPPTSAPQESTGGQGGGGHMLGRNDLCWCGSGKKYKDCHLAADRAGAQAAEREPAVAAEAARREPTAEAAGSPGAAPAHKRRRHRH